MVPVDCELYKDSLGYRMGAETVYSNQIWLCSKITGNVSIG